MDPFTEKLLARTQARKAALAKKREEVAGRSPVVNSPRRPLTESNKNTAPLTSIKTENSKHPDRDASVKAPKGTPVVVTSTQFAGGTPKSVFFEKYAKQASLKQKECFIELGEVRNVLKSTPVKESHDVEKKATQFVVNAEESMKRVSSGDPRENVKACLTANTESPSVKDRKAMYMKQVQVVSTTTAKPCLVATTKQDQEKEKKGVGRMKGKTNGSENVFPSVKDARASLAGGRFFNDPRNEATEKTTANTPGEIASPVPAKPPRKTVSTKIMLEKPSDTKVPGSVPAKPPRSVCQSEASVPPSKPPRLQVSRSLTDDHEPVKQQSSGCNMKRQAPAPPTNNNEGNRETAKISKPVEPVQKGTKRCDADIQSDIPKKKPAVENKVDQGLLSPVQSLDGVRASSPLAVEGTPSKYCDKAELKRTLKSQKISAISLSEMDVNPHEITFNISMTEFDQALEDEKNVMFQMTYDESIKKATQQERSDKTSESDEQNDYEMAVPVSVQPTCTFKGVHKSGYNSVFSDQYAAVVTPKKPKTRPARSYTIHEKIQILLEEAAYQQNIVLQASQAVNTCLALHDGVSTGSSEEVEAERLLKFSTERRTACLDEVQNLKASEEDDDVSMADEPEGEIPCKATLKLSGIKIAVDKKVAQSKNPPEPCIYSFICIIKHSPKQMYCTKALTSEDVKNNCITFDDTFEIKNVKPSFSLDVRVFVLKILLPAFNPANKQKRKTMAKKKASDGASQAVTPGSTQGPVFRTSGFTLASTTHIDLDNVHHGKYKMQQVEKLGLTGDVQVKISCNPEYFNQAKGFLTVFEDVGGLGDWLRYWCILDGSVLHYWKYPDEELIKPPLGSIDLGYCVSECVTVVPRDICARPHTMQLVLEKPVTSSDRETLIAVNAGGKMVIKYMLSADTKADKTTWMNTLNDSLKDWRAWHHNLVSNRKNRAQVDVSGVIML